MFLEISIAIQFSRFGSGTENTGCCLSPAFHIYILHAYYKHVNRVGKIFGILGKTHAQRGIEGEE
jgi:hypothetical protein